MYQLTNNAGRTAFAAPFSQTLRSLSTETQQVDSSPSPSMNQPTTIEAQPHQLKLTGSLPKGKKTKKLSQKNLPSEIAKLFQVKNKIRKSTGPLGSIIEPFYEPHSLLTHPPKPEDVTLELLMASQSHMGHSTSIWNPANQRYIYGIRQGIHIISLEQTAAHLRRAAKVVEGVAYNGGLILFVGTRPGQDRCVIKAASLAKGCHLFQRWIPGTITNGDKILATCASKIVNEHDQVVEGFDEHLREMAVLKPDLVVCLNPLENYICLHECGLHNIPTIGIIDTDANPTWVTYPIPANDDRYVLFNLQIILWPLHAN